MIAPPSGRRLPLSNLSAPEPPADPGDAARFLSALALAYCASVSASVFGACAAGWISAPAALFALGASGAALLAFAGWLLSADARARRGALARRVAGGR